MEWRVQLLLSLFLSCGCVANLAFAGSPSWKILGEKPIPADTSAPDFVNKIHCATALIRLARPGGDTSLSRTEWDLLREFELPLYFWGEDKVKTSYAGPKIIGSPLVSSAEWGVNRSYVITRPVQLRRSSGNYLVHSMEGMVSHPWTELLVHDSQSPGQAQLKGVFPISRLIGFDKFLWKGKEVLLMRSETGAVFLVDPISGVAAGGNPPLLPPLVKLHQNALAFSDGVVPFTLECKNCGDSAQRTGLIRINALDPKADTDLLGLYQIKDRSLEFVLADPRTGKAIRRARMALPSEIKANDAEVHLVAGYQSASKVSITFYIATKGVHQESNSNATFRHFYHAVLGEGIQKLEDSMFIGDTRQWDPVGVIPITQHGHSYLLLFSSQGVLRLIDTLTGATVTKLELPHRAHDMAYSFQGVSHKLLAHETYPHVPLIRMEEGKVTLAISSYYDIRPQSDPTAVPRMFLIELTLPE